MSISKELLDILACPKCKNNLKLTEKENGLVCEKCKKVYPIQDDIPILLIEEAIDLEKFYNNSDK
ncbi:MAG: Trm112 family protein [Desulfonauticus sp.]|nr:Trm112 family protein [Desulfonauticus sp.]